MTLTLEFLGGSEQCVPTTYQGHLVPGKAIKDGQQMEGKPVGSGNLFANLYPQAAEQENVLHKKSTN